MMTNRNVGAPCAPLRRLLCVTIVAILALFIGLLRLRGANSVAQSKAAASEQPSEKAVHVIESFLKSNSQYHLLGLSDVPKTVLEDTRSGESWASRGLRQADMLRFAIVEGDADGVGIDDVAAIIVRSAGDHKLYSLICLNGRKGAGYNPTPFWVVRDSRKFIGNVYIASSIFVIYDDLGSGGWEPDEDYTWNGSAYEERYLVPGARVCASAGKKLFSLPSPTSTPVTVFKADVELLILSAVPRKAKEVRWYKVQVLRNDRKTSSIGFAPRTGLNPNC